MKNNNPLQQQHRVIIYDVILPGMNRPQAEERLKETEGLLETYGGTTVLKVLQRRHHAGSHSFIGKAKLEEILTECLSLKATLIIINAELKPRQKYNIETVLEDRKMKHIKLWDRIDLILQIFDKHARTAEAKLQIELAKIQHFGPRIYGMGDELSNQGGGIGTRGIGETNTEIMKRHLSAYKQQIRKKIAKLQKSRMQNRKRREKGGIKTVALVGYTNAGKSQLFKALTRKKVLVKDALFATLDTTTSRLFLPGIKEEVLLADTIGFIQSLPPDLIEAFKSTLEEAIHADVLLHVIDVSDPNYKLKIDTVNDVLQELAIGDIPIIEVYNKIDKLEETAPKAELEEKLCVSAKFGLNLENLLTSIETIYIGEIQNA